MVALNPTLDPQKAVVKPRKLDDVMLAMDVVDTLRHDAKMLEHDLSAPDREQQLIKRLREIYANQGIDVPDNILREGVQALDDHRFAYKPQKGGFFSNAYIHRGKWGKPFVIGLSMVAIAVGLEYTLIEMPKKRKLAKIERVLSVDIPDTLNSARAEALSVAKTTSVKEKIEDIYAEGLASLKARNAQTAQISADALTAMLKDLNQSYTVRIVSRPGNNSGVFRINDASAGARNYYLIVEGINARGKPVDVTITSQEDQKTKRTTIWGVRVSETVYQSVAADKRDDQIIQNADIGMKKRGYLQPEYSIKTLGGLIVEW